MGNIVLLFKRRREDIMKYYGGCDVGSTYTKAVILDEDGKMVADTTIKSKIIIFRRPSSSRVVMGY